MTSVNAEVPLVTLLGDSFATDPSGFAEMLSDIVLDGLVNDPETPLGHPPPTAVQSAQHGEIA
jgi:hypothetical protein